jgi:presequence protease
VKETYSLGQTIGGYTVTRVEAYKQVQGTYLELKHNATGAKHMHVACADDNNAFMLTFPTIPQDDTGVAHILEHIVLCGSEKFPVRDPFFSMLPRSLNTFMNAMTSSAWTTYPFSTRNQKDFFNLLEVYLDATFFPKISEEAYQQEAWRFEFADGANPETPLEYKGIVFNEMKGAMANAGDRLYRALSAAIFPDITYGNNSGGEPSAIPDLTWQNLKDFHATHYHPSNSYFYTYGNFSLKDTLEVIEKNVLSRFTKLEKDWSVPNQPRFTEPRYTEVSYAIAPTEAIAKKAQVIVAWLTTPITNGFELLSLRILQRVLLANASSPLRRALIESNLGSALSDYTGLNDDPREAMFSAGLKDADLADTNKIERLILETLEQIVQNGVDQAAVDAAIHRFEIEAREVSNAGFPFAFKPGFDALGAYLYGGDPFSALQLDADLEKLAIARKNGAYFENLIKTHLLENPHRVTLVLKPDPELTAREEAEEKAKLEQIKTQLSPAQTAQIIADAAKLEADQNSQQNFDLLPTVELSDVPMTFEDVPHSLETIHGATVGLFAQPTQGLTYLDYNIDFSGLSASHKALLPFFAFAMTKMGAGNSTYLEMANRIEAHTGGINAGIGFRRAPNDLNIVRQSFAFSVKTLHRNLEPTFGILQDFLCNTQFDRAHLKNLLGMYKASLDNRLTSAGHMYAARMAEAQLSGLGALRETMEGITHVRLARELATRDDAGLDSLIAEFKEIMTALFCAGNARICITTDADQISTVKTQMTTLLAALPAFAPSSSSELPDIHPRQARAVSVATPVAYDVALFTTVPFVHPDAPKFMALSEYLRNRYLHKEIREKGGAYGGFAGANREDGTFALISYRDPHIKRTFDIFDGINDFMAQPFEKDALKESILAACADLDPLGSPDTKGRSRFFNDLSGYTLEARATFKKRLLETSEDDLRRIAKAYLQNPRIAVVSSQEKIDQANALMNGIFNSEAV